MAETKAIPVGLPVMQKTETNGLTVKQLKQIINKWSETDIYGDDCEVWVMTGENLSSQVKSIIPLNYRKEGNIVWADLLLDSESFSA